MKNIFEKNTVEDLVGRINKLTNETAPLWGKMNVAQMLAHSNVMYEMAYEDLHQPAKGIKRFLLKLLIKPMVCNEKSYPKNSRTAGQFLVSNEKDFENEKKRLEAYLWKTEELGKNYFEGKSSNSFGPLTSTEWNNMFYKHLDHHLQQFGV